MNATVNDIIKAMERLAPARLAENWDNVGLQVGQRDWPVRTVWVALDPTPDVVAAACKRQVDLLITHHPLIFQPLKSIDPGTPMGGTIASALQHRMAIFAAHTNFDSVAGGLNDLLASRIGIRNIEVLAEPKAPENYKLVLFVPADYEDKILEAVFKTGLGRIGAYTCCSFRNSGIGTFRPESGTEPFTGRIDEISHADELRVEVVISKADLGHVVEQIRKVHPYEVMAYDVYPLITPEGGHGLGRVGELDEAVALQALARKIRETLGLASVRVVGRPDLMVRKVAVCTGSGSSLMKEFFLSGAQVYISGDLRYHDARAAEDADLGLIDVGHFGSEHLIVEALSKRLGNGLAEIGMDVEVAACDLEKDPFLIL